MCDPRLLAAYMQNSGAAPASQAPAQPAPQNAAPAPDPSSILAALTKLGGVPHV